MADVDKVLQLLERERQRLTGDIADLEADSPASDDFRDLSNTDDDDAAESEDFSRIEARKDSVKAQLSQVERAIAKVHEGTYGKDDETGAEIPEARLEAIPWAIYTVETEEKFGR